MVRILRTAYTAILCVFCILLIASCNEDGGVKNPITVPSLPSTGSNNKPEPSLAPNTRGDSLTRTDEEGLVQVQIEDGIAYVSFDLDKWDKLYDIYNPYTEYHHSALTPEDEGYFDLETMTEGPFPIYGTTGSVKDAYIGKIAELDFVGYPDFVTPSVFLLMEDGSLEWVLADPYATADTSSYSFENFESYGQIPFLSNIVDFSYENSPEGMGEKTIYAIDSGGLRYDVRIPAALIGFYDNVWTTSLVDDMVDDSYIYGDMMFSWDGYVSFLVRKEPVTPTQGIELEFWFGTYEVMLAENEKNPKHPPGSIVLDMDLEWHNYGVYGEDIYDHRDSTTIRGSYRMDASTSYYFFLYPNDGDDLYPHPTDQYGYAFWTDSGYSDTVVIDVWMLTESELTDWLLYNVYEAYDRVMNMRGGLVPYIDASTSDIPEVGTCRNIWLGTDLDDKFTKEILYTVAPWGTIYEYDPVYDSWILCYEGGAYGDDLVVRGLAYIKFDRYLDNDTVQLLIDEVDWIDDYNAPNGYRIENPQVQWDGYPSGEWVDILLWFNDHNYGLMQGQESLFGLVSELQDGWRKDEGVLADITISNGRIITIHERYVP